MNLKNKKKLASKVLGVGKERVYFDPERAKEVSEAITRRDILDLKEAGIIYVKDKKGRKKVVKRKHKRGQGKVKKKVKKDKKKYMTLTRKLRAHLKDLKRKKEIDLESYYTKRKEIRASKYKSKRHLVTSIKEEQ
jgi:large subunit ribosomal protein L19e